MYENTSMMFELLEIIEEISVMLDIEAPGIIITEDGPFATDTTMAAIVVGNLRALYLNPNYFSPDSDIGPEQIYAIGHELRHYWQIEKGASFNDYITSDKTTLDIYNAQWQEKDANAFGIICIEYFYDEDIAEEFLDDLLLTLSEDTINNILARSYEIIDNEEDMFEMRLDKYEQENGDNL